MRRLGMLLRRAADALDEPPIRKPEPTPVRITRASRFLRDADAAEARRCHALALLDPEVLGYLLYEVRSDDNGAYVDMRAQLDDEHWPAVTATLARTVLATADVERL